MAKTTETKLRTLSVRQPSAGKIMEGDKTIENRSKPFKYRGPLLIHASGKHDELATGVILGAVDLIECVHFDIIEKWSSDWDNVHHEIPENVKNVILGNPEAFFQNAFGEWCWILGNPRWLDEPVKAVGKVGIWFADENNETLKEVFFRKP